MRVVFVGRDRVVWKRLVLYIVTFGISRRIWLYRVNKEIDGHAALAIDHRLNAFLLALPIIGPFIVQCQTTGRLNRDLHSDAELKYGPTWALCLLGLVPILGNGFYIGWTQDRLNRYWAHERDNPQHGIDIDVGLEEDPEFRKKLDKARKESYEAGSRFDRRKRERQERWRARIAPLETIGEERRTVREQGGSTPLLPWRRPQPLERRLLHITCQCGHGFDLETDFREAVEITCPKCQRKETLRGLTGAVV
ncbi:MAG: FmdB family zinc ribbon protein [Thermoplasmatota archaeon]